MGLLKKLKMLDLLRLLPGPHCFLLSADLEIEVLKIENPKQGDYPPAIGSFGEKTAQVFLL